MIVNIIRCIPFFILALIFPSSICANPPVLSYLFPSGGQRGKDVQVRIGGLFLHSNTKFEITGSGLSQLSPLKQFPLQVFDGPLLPLTESQQAEDYPKELVTQFRITPDASLSTRLARVWNSEGVQGGWKFELGDYPEILEKESEHYHATTLISLPITINGRIYPKNDFDDWQIKLNKGEVIAAFVSAEKLGSPLDAQLEVLNAKGEIIADNDDASGIDPELEFKAPEQGIYIIRIRESAGKGGPSHIYRLTITKNPRIKTVFPLGGKSDSLTKFNLDGTNLESTTKEIQVPKPLGFQPLPFLSSTSLLIDVGNHVEVVEQLGITNPSIKGDIPCAINGRILAKDEVDIWELDLQSGQKISFESRGLALSSPCRPKITISDLVAKEIASAISIGELDPVLQFTAPSSGKFLLKIAEQIPGRYGPNFAYRICLLDNSSKQPSFSFVENSLTILRGSEATLNLKLIRPTGFDDKVDIIFGKFPSGVEVSSIAPAFAKGQSQVAIKLKANSTAKIDSFLLDASITLPNKSVITATIPFKQNEFVIDKVRVAVALPCPFKIVGEYNMKWGYRGSTLSRNYKLERNGFNGPIHIEMADRQARHLQGVSAVPKIIPAGSDDFEYSVQLAPYMEIGRTSRICVAGFITILDQGEQHIVSYSSVNPNEQIIAVVAAGRLEITCNLIDVPFEPGKTSAVTIEVFRAQDLVGEALLQLDFPEWTGMKSISTVIKPDSNKATVEIPVPSSLKAAFPVFVRSSIRQGSLAHESRLKLEMVPKIISNN